MKCSAVVLGVVLLAATVSGQTNSKDLQLPAAPGSAAATVALSEPAQPLNLLADAAPGGAISLAPLALSAPADPEPMEGPPVITALPAYEWELYAGYSFFNFYEVPNVTNLENGFDVAATFYPGGGWIGAEGDLQATFGHQLGCTSKFVLGSGGLRLRWAGPRGMQFFLHGLAGGAHYFPQTAYGGPNAFGYEAGGGVDVAHGRRMALRGEVDAVGTRFFGTYQYSPKVSLGIVFKF